MTMFSERLRMMNDQADRINRLVMQAEKTDAERLMKGIEQLVTNDHSATFQVPRA